MNTMTPEMILSQILFWSITVASGFIAYEFYISQNGKLRKLIIELFCAKMFVYGGAGLYYLLQDLGMFHDAQPIWMRVVLNFPMAIVMVRLYRFIKWGK